MITDIPVKPLTSLSKMFVLLLFLGARFLRRQRRIKASQSKSAKRFARALG